MDKETATIQIREKYTSLSPVLDERSRRIWAATEARAFGEGGQVLVARAIGIHKNTVWAGMKEIDGKKAQAPEGTIRRCGGGRKKNTDKDDTLTKDIQSLVESSTRGEPESPLLWCSKSVRNIAEELNTHTKRISHVTVSKELATLGYSLQANRKTQEGGSHSDRDAQFCFINKKTKRFQKKKCPVISVDTKKKENIGNFKNNGQEYRKKGDPENVSVYDFIDKEKGKVSPYGIYDLDKNTGWVSVGISSDTSQFAVQSIRSWWYDFGEKHYKDAKEILITADCGGSNGYRVRLWKAELQKLATELKKTIHISHFPPGTSKWNKIEHKLFCFISKNWRGKPLTDRATVVNLIGSTKTKNGLTVTARLDENQYKKGIKVSDTELAKINLHKETFHGEWNYAILPRAS